MEWCPVFSGYAIVWCQKLDMETIFLLFIVSINYDWNSGTQLGGTYILNLREPVYVLLQFVLDKTDIFGADSLFVDASPNSHCFTQFLFISMLSIIEVYR